MLKLIKIIHSLIWAIMVAAILYTVYAGITDNLNIYLWMSIGLIIFEGIVLLINKGSCPLTVVARKVKKDYKEGDDIYLPRWLARNNKLIFTSIFIIGLLIVVYRLIW